MIFRSHSPSRSQDDFHREALPHLDALYGAAVYMTKDARDAEDLVQETFLKAYRFFDRYKPGTNCKAWLFRIMTNTHINRNRGKHREFSLIDNIDIDSGDEDPIHEHSEFYKDPEQGYLHRLVHAEVKDALDSLPADFRNVVILADLQDFAYKEIAEIIDCPIGTVMSRLHRGRKLLQKRLRAHAIAQGIIPATPREESPGGTEGGKLASLDQYRARRAATTP